MSESKPSRGFGTEEFEDAIDGVLKESPVVTSRWVADLVGCSRERARQYLKEQFHEGVLDRRQVGGGAMVYFPMEMQRVASQLSEEIVLAQTDTQDDVASAQIDKEERVLFFPSRREIAVDRPDSETRRVLSQIAHLVDSTGQSYLYKVSEEDNWNAPYDEFDT